MYKDINNKIDFTTACGTVIPFGKFRGKTIARIGSHDDGLRWLDWLLSEREKEPARDPALLDALRTYLLHPAVAREVDRATGDVI